MASEQEGVEAKLRTLLGGDLGPTGRRLLGRAFAVMYERGNTLGLHGMIGRCCEALKSKDEGPSSSNLKRCAHAQCCLQTRPRVECALPPPLPPCDSCLCAVRPAVTSLWSWAHCTRRSD